ncbi:MAG TPA: tetratricopeptide repeat protein [Bacteroidales bacterium]|nr:tetratricopeptide repeat protein [Bacteroidales bacterium]
MKQIFYTARLLFTLTLASSCLILNGQDIPKKIATEICNCVDTLENMDSLEAKVDRCAQQGMEAVIEASSDEIQEIYSSEDAVEEAISKAMESLMGSCPKIRKFVIQDRKQKFYTKSASAEANKYFEDGNDLFGKNDYKGALKLYSKALKSDPNYIYAIDNTGLAYRKMGDTKKAIKFYKKSLDIYPEGSFALKNLGYAYSLSNDFQDAMLCYQKLAFFYPDDPEGYFGIGKLFVATGQYETAIDYIFTAHRIYKATGSEYSTDSEKMISVIYNKLREQNKLDTFNQKASEYGINYN